MGRLESLGFGSSVLPRRLLPAEAGTSDIAGDSSASKTRRRAAIWGAGPEISHVLESLPATLLSARGDLSS